MGGPPADFVYAERVLGATREEMRILCHAWVKSHSLPYRPERELLWLLERAMKRREGTVLVEELTEEEARSEEKLWWRVRRDIGNASYYLKKRWVFGDEADEIVSELEALHDRVQDLARRVTQHH